MKRQFIGRAVRCGFGGLVLLLAALWSRPIDADQIEMTNGDRYVGRVVTLGPDTLVVQSEVLGTLKLPRTRISSITLSTLPKIGATNTLNARPILSRSNLVARAAISGTTNTSQDLSTAIRQLAGSSNSIQQVQQQLLAGAGPEAQTKFNDLVGGLLSGRVNMDDLRAQAKSTLAQAKAMRKDLGEEGGGMLDSYLSILESFLKETESQAVSTNAPSSSGPKLAPKPLEQE